MSSLGRVVRTMMHLLLVRLLLLVLVLVAMWLTPTNTTDSPALEFALSSLYVASDEQYESIPTTRSPCWRESSARCISSARRGGDLLGADLSAATPPTSSPTALREKLDSSSNTYYYTKRNNYIKGDDKKKYRFRDKKKKKFQKMMSQACAALSDLDFSSDDSTSSEEDERPKRKTGDFTSLCLLGKSSTHPSIPST
jgi:hypothetical protein